MTRLHWQGDDQGYLSCTARNALLVLRNIKFVLAKQCNIDRWMDDSQLSLLSDNYSNAVWRSIPNKACLCDISLTSSNGSNQLSENISECRSPLLEKNKYDSAAWHDFWPLPNLTKNKAMHRNFTTWPQTVIMLTLNL